MNGIALYLRLLGATAVVLAPGWLLARALGVRGVAATLGWSFTLLFGALAVTFALQASLTLTMVLLASAALAALVALLARGFDAPPTAPGQPWVWGAGVALGMILWRVGKEVEGDGLFHLARARKLLDFGELSLDRVSEFADGSLHPGYAFPLWHGFLALVAKVSGVDPEQVVVHLPSVLAVLAVVVAYEAGWALFRRTWAAGAVTAAQVGIICFAPGHGGAFTVLSLPATSSRQLLVPAALALAFEAIRRRSLALYASTAAAGFALAVVHPTYAIFLWIPFVGFLLVRALWARDGRASRHCRLRCAVGSCRALHALADSGGERHGVGLARRAGGSAGAGTLRRPARRPLRDALQPGGRGVHEERSGRGSRDPAVSARGVRRAQEVGGVRRRRDRSRFSS